jgi:hypothetical protein
MSFLGSLAKGFIRSAVNQVGRDGGKVISNNVYGNAHSTPVNSFNNLPKDDLIDDTTLIKEKEYPLLKIIYAVIISFALPIVGSLIVIYRAILNLNAKEMTLFRLEKQGVYSQDKRYTSGKRYEGNRIVKIPVKVSISLQESKLKTIKGILYLVIAISVLIFYILFYSNS